MTTRADIMNIPNQEEAFALIDIMNWNNKRKSGERALWKRKHCPELINKNPAKGNRNGKLNVKDHSLLDMSIEELQKLKDDRNQKLLQSQEELEAKIKKYEDQVETWKAALEQLRAKLR